MSSPLVMRSLPICFAFCWLDIVCLHCSPSSSWAKVADSSADSDAGVRYPPSRREPSLSTGHIAIGPTGATERIARNSSSPVRRSKEVPGNQAVQVQTLLSGTHDASDSGGLPDSLLEYPIASAMVEPMHHAGELLLAEKPAQDESMTTAKFFEHTDVESCTALIVSVVALLMLDRLVLQRELNTQSLWPMLAVTLLWQVSSFWYLLFVTAAHGYRSGALWLFGYMLEYSLSVDNLFCFALIFMKYKTPNAFVHTALFSGLLIGLVTRTVLFFVLGSVFSKIQWLVFVFAAFLIYGGVMLLHECWSSDSSHCGEHEKEGVDEAEFARLSGPAFGILNIMRIWPHYDSQGSFFVRLKENSDTICEPEDPAGRWHCTLLVPVILTIELCDVMFAMDSVSAILFEVEDFMLCCSCMMYATIGTRTLFFLVQMLKNTFHFVKYGIAVILVLVGLELLLHQWCKPPPWASVVLMVLVLSISVGASVLTPVAPDRLPPIPRSSTALAAGVTFSQGSRKSVASGILSGHSSGSSTPLSKRSQGIKAGAGVFLG